MKRILAFFLVLSLMILFASCAVKPEPEIPAITEAEQSTEPEPEPIPECNSKLVGISMPTDELKQWDLYGNLLEKQLTEAGYEVDLQFAENDPATQISQIEQMIEAGAKVLVISAVDGEALGTVLEQASEAGCTIIAYNRMIWGSDKVNYYITFDNYQVGLLQGKFIEEQLDLPNAGARTYNIEFATGDPMDGNLVFLYFGAQDILEPYIKAGTLIVQSGQSEPMDVTTVDWDSAIAQERFEELLTSYYSDKPLDAVLSTNDSVAQGIAAALETSYSNEVYPIITGLDCDILSVRNILEGKQAMSLLMLPNDLAEKAAEMCIAILNGEEPEINDTKTYDNGTGIIPSYLCSLRVCTVDNYKELLLDSGYYSEEAFEDITSYITGPAGTAQESQCVKYQVKDDHIVITGLSDEGKLHKTIEIPSMIDGKPVTEIKAEAFRNCIDITGISIPESVTQIGARAFYNCKALTSLTLPESMESIGKNAFSHCQKLPAIHLPEGITSIEGFNGCTSLTKIVIPKGVTKIEGFNDCSSLADIEIPEGVTSIEGFNDCTSLTEIVIPEGVTSIGGFCDCIVLKNITIPDSATIIWGFYGCPCLERNPARPYH